LQTKTLKYNFLKNYFSFSIGVWINAVISFFSTPVVSWLINPSEYGKGSMFLTVYSIMLLITLFGAPNALMRFYFKRDDREQLLWSSLIVPINLSIAFAILSFIFRKHLNLFLVGQESSNAYLILSLAVFLGVFQVFNQTVIRMQNKGLVYSALQVVNSLSNIGFVLAYALLIQRNFYALLYAQLFSKFITLCVGIYFQREYWFPIRVNKHLIKEIVAYSYPFLFSGLLWWLLGWTDRIVLRLYISFTEIGLYSAGFKLVSVIALFTTGFSTFWHPFAYEQYEKNPENKVLFSKAFDYISFLILALALVVISAKNLIFMLFSSSYRPAAYIAPFLLLNPVMLTMAIVVARGIDFAKKTHWFIVSDGIAALFNLVGNFLLVPIFGTKGAALTTGLSYIIVFLIESCVSVKLYPVKYNLVRTYVSTAIFIVVAAVNSFIEKASTGVLSSVVGLALVVFLYKDVFKQVVKDLLKLRDLVVRKLR